MARKKKNIEEVSGQATRAAATGIVKLPLGKCLTAPNSRFYADLHKAALSLARARNAMARHWLRWHEDMAFHIHENRQNYFERWQEWRKDKTEGESSEVLVKRWAKWIEKGGFAPPMVEYDGRWLAMESVFYNVGRAFDRTPEGALPIAFLNTSLLTPCSGDVMKDLLSKTSYRHQGEADFRWQGVLNGEMQLSDYGRSLYVPVKNNDAVLAWDDLLSPSYSKASRLAKAKVDHYRTSECVLLVPLFSGSAGRKMPFHVVRINTRHLPDGLKKNLRNIIAGVWKWSDSSLHFDEVKPNSKRARKGKKSRWYLHLCYQQPAEESKLTAGREAYLILNDADSADPWEVGMATGTAKDYPQAPKPWKVGNGIMLKAAFGRQERIKREWNFRHQARGSGRRSHGHGREYRDFRLSIRRSQDLAKDALLKSIAEIVRYCVQHDLGTLDFRMPSLAVRARCWYPKNGVPMNWEDFKARLKHECWQNGVRLRLRDEETEQPQAASG